MFEKIAEIIAEQLSIDVEKVTLESSFIGDLGADSLDMVELVMCLEDEMDIKLEDEQLVEVKTVADVIELIENNK